MRTALVLLFLLAVAAIPGSLLPQKDVNIEDVRAYVRAHPTAGPILERLWAFEVFASPWFSAIYLLLFTSLVGCIVPRLAEHWRALRAVPPKAPARLDRLPMHAPGERRDGAPAQVAAELRAALRARRWRAVARAEDGGAWAVSAEKGYLKETGNLLFHSALIAVLLGVAAGSWYGWHGNRLLVAGADRGFCNAVQQFDEYGVGPRVGPAALPGFCLTLTEFRAEYRETGQPESFRATVRVERDGPARTESFSVNDPLRLDGANVYLFGHGYAPVLRYTDRYGRTQTVVAPFLTVDETMTGEGAAKFPDANVDPATGRRDPSLQVGFEGLFLPTAPGQPPFVRSAFPEPRDPAVLLRAYRGNLGEDAGIPTSVYRIDQRQVEAGRLKEVGEPKLLRPGDTWTLDDGSRVQFVGTERWITLSVRHDPGQRFVLAGVVVLLAGLMMSLAGRRRRVFFRVTPAPAGPSPTDGSSVVGAGGLPRSDYPGFAEEFTRVVAETRGAAPAAPAGETGTFVGAGRID
ncbi:MAG TPA: cytochrome c biogenesis protein ResB [Pilimelia sp.]|nr:cytochrome c biogenesis protein ResB [Pilimelia sp.]